MGTPTSFALSNRVVEKLTVEKDTVFWDRELTGFGVRVYPSGGKVYVAQARGPAHPEGMQYSRFCQMYRAWAAKLDVVMRFEHRAGEKTFVDYAGHTVGVVDRETGELREAQVFVAVLGASNYTYAEATWTQTLPDWTASHVRAFEFYGGCSELLIPDNLRSAVSRAHRYEPDINPTYHDLARHYGVAVLPARVRKPRDKAKAEVGVQVVERWVLAALRHRTFFSLVELNAAIATLLERLNNRPCGRAGREWRRRG